MNYRTLGKTGYEVSEVSFGAWAIGGSWGEVSEGEAMAALHQALDEGINFFDSADVYGDGRSERLLARLKKERPDESFYVATKAGRRLDPHTAEGYNRDNLRRFVARSRDNLDTDTLDLLQLHCPPTEVYYQPEVFAVLDELVAEGQIRHYGVSVEKVEEGLKALAYPDLATVQIIFNPFRQRPAELFLSQAQARDVGVIVRVPLASGLLTGKMSKDESFPDDDHRNFNREGEAFDRGETFAGVDFETGLAAVDKLRPLVPEDATMPELALRWILMFEAVSCTIPGAKRPEQVSDNAAASELASLPHETMETIRKVYEEHIFDQVHHRW
ncbi:MAG: aldo/keto reductase [Trueperaceae bacterium]|nr:aldo/keto reductase [Trueperaceae bacterium]